MAAASTGIRTATEIDISDPADLIGVPSEIAFLINVVAIAVLLVGLPILHRRGTVSRGQVTWWSGMFFAGLSATLASISAIYSPFASGTVLFDALSVAMGGSAILAAYLLYRGRGPWTSENG